MLKIYNNKEEVPEEEKEFFDKHYKKRSDGKWEPDIEGVNSVHGILTKNRELTDKINNELNPKIREFEGKEILTDGKIAVDKKEYDAIKAEHGDYVALGTLEVIKPKVEGYDSLKEQNEAAERKSLLTRAFKAAGVTDIDAAFDLAITKDLNLESETKDGKEVFNVVTEKDGKRESISFSNAYLKEADGFKKHYSTLTGTTPKGNTGDPNIVGMVDDSIDPDKIKADSQKARSFF